MLSLRTLFLGVALTLSTSGLHAQIHPAVPLNHAPVAEHISQQDLNDLVMMDPAAAFITAFDHGDELFEFDYNALDGGGANVGNGQRYTRVPRPDLDQPGQWATHIPPRATGPNGSSCISCHSQPVGDGAGGPSSNAMRDPTYAGLSGIINRNTPHLHGMGALQRLAEEMTQDLFNIRDAALLQALQTGLKVSVPLVSKGVPFGRLQAHPSGELVTLRVRGVDPDLIVRPYQWKGNVTTARQFNMDAFNNELGMQGSEVAGFGVDGDFDGVADELTIGDGTAMTIYLAAQPRPLTRRELASVGEIPPLTSSQIMTIERGDFVFNQIGCANCHVPTLPLGNPIFSEPSQFATHRDSVFAGGVDPLSVGLSPATAVTFDLTADQPDNQFMGPNGELIHLGAFPSDGNGGALIGLFGDLKRHEMGPALAESIDETGHGNSVWMTKELWGVGGTAPYLHDGRATTITEAISFHGGESQTSTDNFFAMSGTDQQALIAFLDDMTLFLPAE